MQLNKIFFTLYFYTLNEIFPTLNKLHASSVLRIFSMPIYILFETLLNVAVLCVARRYDAAFAAANFVGNEETFVVDSIVEMQRALEGSRCRC